MTRPPLIPAALALAVLLAAFPAWGQEPPPCVPRTDFLDHLSENYDEVPIAMGMTSSGKVLEVIASDNGSWTIFVTFPDGTSCGLASGENWQEVVGVKGEAT